MFLLLFLPSLSLFLPTSSSSSPTEQVERGPNQNQPLLDNTFTAAAVPNNLDNSLGTPTSQDPSAWWNQNQPLLDNTFTAAGVPNNLGNSLGTPASQDPSAWWNQNQNQDQDQVDVKPPGEGSDNTGRSSSSLLSFDASSSDSNGAALALSSSSSTLPSSFANDLNPNRNPSTHPTTTSSTDGSNPSLALLSPNGEGANPESQTAGSSSSTTSPSSFSPGSSIPGTSNPSGEGQQQQQQMALIGDERDVGFPLNLLPTVGGDAPMIDLNSHFNPKIPQPLSFPIRYNDKERLDDPQTPDCDEGMFPFCCNLGPPDPVDYKKNAHKRRDCRSFDPMWEGCHWRQNMFCCKCADRSTNLRVGIGCYSVWYRGNPFYDEKKLPKPVKPANPKVDQLQQSGGEEGNAAQELPGELPETQKRPFNLPGTGKALPGSCSKKQLDYWRETNYI